MPSDDTSKPNFFFYIIKEVIPLRSLPHLSLSLILHASLSAVGLRTDRPNNHVEHESKRRLELHDDLCLLVSKNSDSGPARMPDEVRTCMRTVICITYSGEDELPRATWCF